MKDKNDVVDEFMNKLKNFFGDNCGPLHDAGLDSEEVVAVCVGTILRIITEQRAKPRKEEECITGVMRAFVDGLLLGHKRCEVTRREGVH